MHRLGKSLLFAIFGAICAGMLNGIAWFLVDYIDRLLIPRPGGFLYFGPELTGFIGAVIGLGLGSVIGGTIATTHVSRSVGTLVGGGVGLVAVVLLVIMTQASGFATFLPLASALSGGVTGLVIATSTEERRCT